MLSRLGLAQKRVVEAEREEALAREPLAAEWHDLAHLCCDSHGPDHLAVLSSLLLRTLLCILLLKPQLCLPSWGHLHDTLGLGLGRWFGRSASPGGSPGLGVKGRLLENLLEALSRQDRYGPDHRLVEPIQVRVPPPKESLDPRIEVHPQVVRRHRRHRDGQVSDQLVVDGCIHLLVSRVTQPIEQLHALGDGVPESRSPAV